MPNKLHNDGFDATRKQTTGKLEIYVALFYENNCFALMPSTESQNLLLDASSAKCKKAESCNNPQPFYIFNQ